MSPKRVVHPEMGHPDIWEDLPPPYREQRSSTPQSPPSMPTPHTASMGEKKKKIAGDSSQDSGSSANYGIMGQTAQISASSPASTTAEPNQKSPRKAAPQTRQDTALIRPQPRRYNHDASIIEERKGAKASGKRLASLFGRIFGAVTNLARPMGTLNWDGAHLTEKYVLKRSKYGLLCCAAVGTWFASFPAVCLSIHFHPSLCG